MGVDKARQDRFAAQIDFLHVRSGKIQYFGIASYGEESPARNCHCLGARLQIIDGEKVAAVQDQVGFFRVKRREQRDRGQRAEKFST